DEGAAGANPGVLFDVDAIRAELAKEKLEVEVKELQSTLPPMKLDLRPKEEGPADGSARDSKSTEFEAYRAPGGEPAVLSPRRAPTIPKDRDLASSPYYQQPHEPEEEIQMTF